METLKLIHLFFIIAWLGYLIVMAHLLQFYKKEAPDAQLALQKIYKKLQRILGTPSMTIGVIIGFLLLPNLTDQKLGWLHMKLFCVAGLVICHLFYSWKIENLHNPKKNKSKLEIFTYATIVIFLFGSLSSILVLRNQLNPKKEVGKNEVSSL